MPQQWHSEATRLKRQCKGAHPVRHKPHDCSRDARGTGVRARHPERDEAEECADLPARVEHEASTDHRDTRDRDEHRNRADERSHFEQARSLRREPAALRGARAREA